MLYTKNRDLSLRLGEKIPYYKFRTTLLYYIEMDMSYTRIEY